MTSINHDAYAEKILAALKDQTVPMKLIDLGKETGEPGRALDATLRKLKREGRINFVKGKGAGWRLNSFERAIGTTER